MKKIHIFIGCIIFSIVLWCATNGKTKISVDNITAKETNQTIEVPIKIEENSGICGATLTVAYDEKLELKGISKGNAFSSLTMTPPGDFSQKTLKILWDGVDEDKSNGTLVILRFSNPKKAGTYKINISYKNGDIIDGDLNPVDITVVNGSIKVEDNTESTTETKPTTTTTETKDTCAINGHKGGKATCVKKAVCKVCGKEYGSLDKSNHQGDKELRNYKDCTCTKVGYSGDVYCKACGTKIESGFVFGPYDHDWDVWKIKKQPTVFAAGKKETHCLLCNKKKEQTIAKLKSTIKLSATKKKIKRKKSYTLTISKLARADYVKTVTVNNKKLAKVKKVGKNKYKITAKNKKGKVKITVTLASKKKATCQITVK